MIRSMPATAPVAVIFDWDNTLVDSWSCIHVSINITLEAMGQAPWTIDEAKQRVRRSMRDSFPILFGDRWEEARKIFYDHFAAHHMTDLTALPGAEALLQTLHELGIYAGVVSNKTGRFLREEVEALGWNRYFGRVVGATDATADKPAVDPVILALAPAGLTLDTLIRERTWFVGDADIDMQCAHAAGCLPVLVGNGDNCDFTDYPPGYRLDSCSALSTMVRQLVNPVASPHVSNDMVNKPVLVPCT
ncbi:MAG: HAD family hydrolase [Rhodospirillaceae bacterium]